MINIKRFISETLKVVRKECGAALIQVIMMSGLLGVVSLGVLYLNKNIQTVATITAQNMEVHQLFKRIQTNLKNKETCDSTFKGVSPMTTGTNITVIKSFLQNKNIFQTGKIYGAGRGKISIEKMTLKSYENGFSTFEIAFKRGEKDKGYSVRRIKLNTKLESGVVTECLLDDNNLAKNNCERGFQGIFSDGVNCKSIKISHGENNNYAIKTIGNINVEGDLEAENLITTDLDQEIKNEVNVKTETNSGGLFIGDANQTKLSVDSNGLMTINLKSKGNVIKAFQLLLSKRVSFRFQGDNLIINGKGLDNLKLEDFKEQKSYVKESSSSSTNPKGIVATRAWFYKNLEKQFSDTDKNTMQKLVKKSIEGIEGQSLGIRKSKEDIVLAFGRNICFKYFSQDYEWDETNKECKLKDINVKNCYAGTFEESGFLTGSNKQIVCKKYKTSKVKSNCIREKIPCLKTRGIGSLGGWFLNLFTGINVNSLPCIPGYPNNPDPIAFGFDWNVQEVHHPNTAWEGRCQEFRILNGDAPADPPSGGDPVSSVASPCDNAIAPGSNGQTRINGNNCEKISIKQMSYSKSNQAGCDNDLGKHNSYFNGGKCYFYVYKKQECSAEVVGGSTINCSGSPNTTSNCSGSASSGGVCGTVGNEWEIVELDSYDSDINEVWNQLRSDEGFSTN